MPFLPDNLDPLFALLLIGSGFITSAITAAFGLGGGVAMLAIMGFGLPVQSLIPVHGCVQLGSNISRAFVQRAHIDRQFIVIFAAGAIIGGVIGGLLVTDLPDLWLKLVIAAFILYSAWAPNARFSAHPLLVPLGGVASTILTMFVGATGPFVAALINAVRTDKLQIVATHGACMTLQHGLKIGIFIMLGFDFLPFLPLLGAILVAGFLGTLLGTKWLHTMQDAAFRRAFKLLLTALALLLIGQSLAGQVL